jgi:hypothetical protein
MFIPVAEQLAMRLTFITRQFGFAFGLTLALALLPRAHAASCTAQSQMTAAERTAMSSFARNVAEMVQSGNIQGLRDNTIPQVAANFGGIAASAESLKPSLQNASITVDDLYSLDASTEDAGAPQTDFYCGAPVVVLNFTNLPPGKYGLAIVHATGVSKPQQIALVLSQTAGNRWMLAGFFSRPMLEAGHSGLWYWEQARDYAQKKMGWDAWFYYQTAEYLQQPVQFLSSPNLQKLQQESGRVRPSNLPGLQPMMLNANGSTYHVTAMNTTTEFGTFDLEIHYTPDTNQMAQLRDPVAARKQAIDVMTALLALHPEFRSAFHGIWVQADQGNVSVYSLDLSMDQISPGTASPNPNPSAR